MNLIIGMSNNDVGDLQQKLIEAGESVDPGELRQQYFGPSTKSAVLDFQTHHVDAQGHPLAQDGVVGPATLAALENPSGGPHLVSGWAADLVKCDDRIRPVIAAAVGEIGVAESPNGSNRGPRVDVYTGLSGNDTGIPWCAMFVSWVWGHAVGGSPFGTLASALKLRDWGAQNGRLIGTGTLAQPGDIGIILRAGGHGHVVLMVSNELAGVSMSCVEGNCANAVRATLRLRSAFSHMLRPLA
jgi:hypothetical protein